LRAALAFDAEHSALVPARMSQHGLFAKLGVLIIPEFLDPRQCQELRVEMRRSPCGDAVVAVRGRKEEVADAQRRQTAHVQVSEGTSRDMIRRLLVLKPRAEEFFSMPLADLVEVPKFLIYRQGHFFAPHRDVMRAGDDSAAPIIRARRVNLVVFLNDESQAPDKGGYRGAALTLYGLIDKQEWRQYGFPVCARTGSLVAFRADVLHEVAPIVEGERYNIVSRMLDPSFRPEPAPSDAEGRSGLDR
jgi:SM-20-related protein